MISLKSCHRFYGRHETYACEVFETEDKVIRPIRLESTTRRRVRDTQYIAVLNLVDSAKTGTPNLAVVICIVAMNSSTKIRFCGIELIAVVGRKENPLNHGWSVTLAAIILAQLYIEVWYIPCYNSLPMKMSSAYPSRMCRFLFSARRSLLHSTQ